MPLPIPKNKRDARYLIDILSEQNRKQFESIKYELKHINFLIRYYQRNRSLNDEFYSFDRTLERKGAAACLRRLLKKNSEERRALIIARAFLDRVPFSKIEQYWYGRTPDKQQAYLYAFNIPGVADSYSRFFDRSHSQERAINQASVLLGFVDCVKTERRAIGSTSVHLDRVPMKNSPLTDWVKSTGIEYPYLLDIKQSEVIK